MMRRRYLKTAVPIDEHDAICKRADAEGLSLAGYVRTALARDVERQNIVELLTAIRASLLDSQVTTAARSPADGEPASQEVLQLVRLLASHTNPQAAARITAAFNQQRAKS